MKSRLEYIKAKIVDHDTALRKVNGWRLKDNQIVLTNGCFDILHPGHVSYLAEAASLGNRLVVALNTDESVRRQGKGAERPINNEDARSIILAGLSCVDLVVFFNGDTPIEIIQLLQPDILVKGADYDAEEKDEYAKTYIVGSKEVKEYGGSVQTIPLVEGYSTTNIVNKLKGTN